MNRRFVALLFDVVAILLFVVLGRGSHDEGNGIASVLNVAAPFLIGLAVGWLVSPNVRRAPFAVRAGVDVWVSTIVIGMLLRRFAWDRGTAVAFVIVATVFLAIFLIGWRAMSAAIKRPHGEIRSGRPPTKAER